MLGGAYTVPARTRNGVGSVGKAARLSGAVKQVSFSFSDWDSTRSIGVLGLASDRDATVIGTSEFRKVTCGLCRILAGELRRILGHLLSAITLFHINFQNLLKLRNVIVLQSLYGCDREMQGSNIAPVQLIPCHRYPGRCNALKIIQASPRQSILC
jgi:hypothetical protein